MKRPPFPLLLFAAVHCLFLLAPSARASGIVLPPEAKQAMAEIYGGDPDAAIPIARALQQAQPEHPLGYLLEGEALWWKRYCAACEIKYGMVEPWRRAKELPDAAYLALADKLIRVAQAQLRESETAEMHVYAGFGGALKVRVYDLRSEYRNAARAAVIARAEMLRALALDPQMADATAGLGIYNYYVDSLSPLVKLLRIFMGIPGGDKELGVKQMEVGMDRGVLLSTDVRFVLARSLRTFDRKYEQALSVAEPLAQRYPRNPHFLLLLGNLNAELSRNAKASEYFHAALAAPISDPVCAARVQDIANSFLASLK